MTQQKESYIDSLDFPLWADNVALSIERISSGAQPDEVDKKILQEALQFLKESAEGHDFVKQPRFQLEKGTGLREYLWFLQGSAAAELDGRRKTAEELRKELSTALDSHSKGETPVDIPEKLKKFFAALAGAAAAEGPYELESVVID